ncbi:MAG TPA: hypothetical protein VGF99_01165, partial [Myxococcota bacterium]
MTSTNEASEQLRDTLKQALLPPLLFASRDDFKLIERLSGVDELVASRVVDVVDHVGAAGDLARALRAAAAGFDTDVIENKRRRVTRLLALLQGEYVPRPSTPTASATSTATATSTKKPASRPVPDPQGAREPEKSTAKKPTRATRPTTTKTLETTTATDPLTWPLTRLKGVGPLKAAQLHDRGLHSIGELLFTLPRTYEDRREKKKISE